MTAATTVVSQQSVARRSDRDPWVDNARAIAAVLIAVMHFAESFMQYSEALRTLYYATWAWRLPIYILVAGYFSSSTPLTRDRAIPLLRNVLFVYLLFYSIAWGQQAALYGPGVYNPLLPSFTLWFLLSLFWWRLTLPVVANIRFLIPLSLIASLAVGFMDSAGKDLSVSRTLALWPLFLLGWKIKDLPLREWLGRVWVRGAAIAVIGMSLAVGYVVQSDIKARYFTMSRGYGGELPQQFDEMQIRFAVLIFAAVGAAALFALVPRRKIPLVTYLGSGSYYIYLLHPLVIRQLNGTGTMPQVSTPLELFAFLVGAALVAMALGSAPVRRVFRPLIQPRYMWIFHRARALDAPGREPASR